MILIGWLFKKKCMPTPTLQDVTTSGNETTDTVKSTNEIAFAAINGDHNIRSYIGQDIDGSGVVGTNNLSGEARGVALRTSEDGSVNALLYQHNLVSLTVIPPETIGGGLSNRVQQLQDADGTIALISDIPDIDILTLQEVTELGNITTEEIVIQNDITITDGGFLQVLNDDDNITAIVSDGGIATISADSSVLVALVTSSDGTQNEIQYLNNEHLLRLHSEILDNEQTQTFQNASGTIALTSDISAPQDLQSCTGIGAVTTNPVEIQNTLTISAGSYIEMIDISGSTTIEVGDGFVSCSSPDGTVGVTLAAYNDTISNVNHIQYASDSHRLILNTAPLTTNRTVRIPDSSGTIALLSDIDNATKDIVITATDADYTVTSAKQFIKLPTITAVRYVTLPNPDIYEGQIIKLRSVNTAGAYNWGYTGSYMPIYPDSTAMMGIHNGHVQVLESDGTDWIVLSQYP